MRYLTCFVLALLGTLGCTRVVERPVDTTTPFITPAQRAKMPIEERDDPYTIMHTHKPTAPARR